MTEVECLGACVNAPILQVNDDLYEDIDAETVKRCSTALRRGEAPPPGSGLAARPRRPKAGRR